MSTDNTYGKVEFIIGHVWWAFIAWIWYKSILFRCIGTHSLAESKRILLVMLLCCSVLGIVLEIKKHRNGISVLLNLIAGYGLYSVLAYYPIKRRLIQVTIRVVVILAASYSVLILCRKIKSRRKRKRVLVRRIIRAFSAAGIIICTGLAVIMISITFKAVFDTSLIRPSVIPTKESDVEEQTIANNMETLVLLREDTWKSLSVEEKLDVLQQVVRRSEGGVVHVARHETELRRLVQRHLRGEVAEGERDRLAEVTIGRISEESRARVGSGTNEHVVSFPL